MDLIIGILMSLVGVAMLVAWNTRRPLTDMFKLTSVLIMLWAMFAIAQSYKFISTDEYEVTQIGDIVFTNSVTIRETLHHYPFSIKNDRILYQIIKE